MLGGLKDGVPGLGSKGSAHLHQEMPWGASQRTIIRSLAEHME